MKGEVCFEFRCFVNYTQRSVRANFSALMDADRASTCSCLSLGEKEDVDVGEDTSVSDGGAAKKLVELLVVADGELDVSWDDSALLVVLGGVSGELEDLSGEVLKDGSEVHWGTGSDSLGVSSLLQVASDSADWELKSSLGCSGDCFASSLSFSSFASSCHLVSSLFV